MSVDLIVKAWDLFITFYPFTFKETLEIFAVLYGIIAAKDWKKLKSYAKQESVKALELTLEKEDKLNIVASSVHSSIPLSIRWIPMLSKDSIKRMITSVYANDVKPMIKENDENPFNL